MGSYFDYDEELTNLTIEEFHEFMNHDVEVSGTAIKNFFKDKIIIKVENMTEQLKKALQEYNERQNVSAHEIAVKYGINVQDLHDGYAKLRANNAVE